MSSRATWKGNLTLGDMTAAIKVFTGTDERSGVSFNQLHGECNTRIQQKKWCPSCAREVQNNEIVKGHEYAKDQFVVVQPEELEKLEVESTRNIKVESFCDAKEIDTMYFDRTYFIGPNGAGFGTMFALLRDMLGDKAGVGKVALYGREYPVAILRDGRGLRMYTLRTADEVRSIEKVVADLEAVPAQINPAFVEMGKGIVDAMTKPYDPTEFKDEYKAGVQKLVDDRIAGTEPVQATTVVPMPGKAPNIMEALAATLASVRAAKPAKAEKTTLKAVPPPVSAPVADAAKPKRTRKAKAVA